MIPLTFSILSGSACTFLVYVLVQFNREFRHATRFSAGKPILTAADSRRFEPALKVAGMSSRASGGQQAKNEAVMRKEILTSAVLGVIGLLAPFFFVMLLSSPWRH